MFNKKTIIKTIETPCIYCNGTGWKIQQPPNFNSEKLHTLVHICTYCNGTGRRKENIIIFIDNKNKIAIDGDSGK